MATLERAIAIAAEAHAGQVDKAGQAYILHPLRVMLRMGSAHERMAAVLHDVVEDTPVSLPRLLAEGFAPEVIAAVDALTKRPGESPRTWTCRALKTRAKKTLPGWRKYKAVREILLGATH
jgi:(p)ppGpp synthase/HD superfamily hydrolase